MKKKILIIYSGGTIGMTASEKGYVPQKEAFHRYLANMPELRAEIMPDWNIIDMEPLLDSSNVAVREWNQIATLIAENYHQYDGFVILHGTDTMAYTASALSFMLENNYKPVILTGSQIPLCETRNDARFNIITSLMLAADGRVNEVCLYFGGKLLRGNRTTKLSSDGMIAFDSPNFPHLADIGVNISYNKELTLPSTAATSISDDADHGVAFRLQSLDEHRIALIKVFPGINFKLFEPLMTNDLDAVIIEAFGAGNIPNKGTELLSIIEKCRSNDIVLLVCSQCHNGTVSLGAYEASSDLLSAGAISGHDITTEAALVKLYYLFSKGYDTSIVRELMTTNLMGEITEL